MPQVVEYWTPAMEAARNASPNNPLAVWNKAHGIGPAPGTTGAGAPNPTGSPFTAGGYSSPTVSGDYIQSMSDLINQINRDAQASANAARIPGAKGIEEQSSRNIQSTLKGEVPNDVYTALTQRAAERGVATGSPYGANTNADLLRSLGLTSLDLMNRGQTWADQAYKRNPSAELFDPSKLLITPLDAEKLKVAREGQQLDYMAAWLAAQEAANRRKSGYGGGGGGSRGGGPGLAENWSGYSGGTSPYYLPQTGVGGTSGARPADNWPDIANMTEDQMLDSYLYPDYGYESSPVDWGAYDTNQVSYNPNLYGYQSQPTPDNSGGGGLTLDDWMWFDEQGG